MARVLHDAPPEGRPALPRGPRGVSAGGPEEADGGFALLVWTARVVWLAGAAPRRADWEGTGGNGRPVPGSWRAWLSRSVLGDGGGSAGVAKSARRPAPCPPPGGRGDQRCPPRRRDIAVDQVFGGGGEVMQSENFCISNSVQNIFAPFVRCF